MKMPANSDPSSQSAREKLPLRLLWVIRRTHMYLGIMLMPWALLYGMSGYLFNHPTHFQEPNLRAFGPRLVQGTFLEEGLDALKSAEEVVGALNNRFGETGAVSLDPTSPPTFVSDFLFASAQAENETVQLLFYRNGSGGTLFTSAKKAVDDTPLEKARFDIAPGAPSRSTTRETTLEPKVEAEIDDNRSAGPSSLPLHVAAMDPTRLLEAVETVAAKLEPRFEDLKFRVTSAPELQFQIIDNGQSWTSRYNAITGALSSKLTSSTLDSAEAGALPTWRRFLTRLHTSHGYPLEWNARWVWAIIVDVMAFVLVFWGVSGLIMWWQIKRARPMGIVALVISITLAIVVGSGMMQGMR